MIKVLYHKSDLDGWCCAKILKDRYSDAECIGVNYGDPLPFLPLGGKVFVVDFSFPTDMMNILCGDHELFWIDHHKTSIERAHKEKFLASGGQLLEVGKAGCELLWEYLYKEVPMPLVVKLIGRYDVWDHSDPRVLPFQWGMRNRVTSWEDINFNVDVDEVVKEGKLLLSFQEKEDEKYCKSCAFQVMFGGKVGVVINKALCNSKALESVYDPQKHDFCGAFALRANGIWTVSLWSKTIDVSKIAKDHGGGGHWGAAGFTTTKCPF